jgi:SAM-dependent methyltransferase
MTQELKHQVYDFWNEKSCGAFITSREPYSRDYFEEIEKYRYETEPDIFEFAQFTRYRGKKVLEVGVGAGTDFLQWVRAGAEAYGLDLTEEAIRNAERRLRIYGLNCAELRTADAENLPYPDGFFDLVYSWGVIHHSPDTAQALREIIRVTRNGGRCKIMVYNKYSTHSATMYIKHAILKGRPFRGLSDIYWHCQESIGTKVFTRGDILKMLDGLPVADVRINAPVEPRDVYSGPLGRNSRMKDLYFFMLRGLAFFMGYPNSGFHMKIEFTRMPGAAG